MSDKQRKLGKANEKPKVFSLSDIKDIEPHSSDDEKQTYYAGGEKSGTSIQGGGRSKSKEAEDIMKSILAQASADNPSEKETVAFSGNGRKLSGASQIQSKITQNELESDIISINLIFWSEGFTIGTGPLQSFSDPHSLRLLDNIRSGNVSAKDLGIQANEIADIKITQLPDEKFDERKRGEIINASVPSAKFEKVTRQSFTGEGEKLGNESIETITPNTDAQINENIISTRIQVILPDGSRQVFNIAARAKISELYAIIKSKTPHKKFILKTSSPAKRIPEDLDAFVFQVGIMNSSIIMTLE